MPFGSDSIERKKIVVEPTLPMVTMVFDAINALTNNFLGPKKTMGETMPESQPSNAVETPWHLWVIGVVGFLWSSMGAMDYVMTQTKNESYMSAFTPEQLSFFYGFPAWVVAAWAIAVWGGVAGSMFLLLRRNIAVQIFLVSFLAMFVTTFRNYVLSNGLEVVGDPFSLVFTAIIFVIALGLYLYSRAMQSKGVLK